MRAKGTMFVPYTKKNEQIWHFSLDKQETDSILKLERAKVAK
jgi:hypothetical protein